MTIDWNILEHISGHVRHIRGCDQKVPNLKAWVYESWKHVYNSHPLGTWQWKMLWPPFSSGISHCHLWVLDDFRRCRVTKRELIISSSTRKLYQYIHYYECCLIRITLRDIFLNTLLHYTYFYRVATCCPTCCYTLGVSGQILNAKAVRALEPTNRSG